MRLELFDIGERPRLFENVEVITPERPRERPACVEAGWLTILNPLDSALCQPSPLAARRGSVHGRSS